MIRKAKLSDAEDIQRLVNSWAKKGKLLRRSLNYIFEHLRDFWVFLDKGKVVGCCALSVTGWQNLAEIKSLAVLSKYQKKNIGKKLVKISLKEASSLGIKGVFALTYSPEFFTKVGFKIIDRKKLPHKIWSDCINCSEFPGCSEEAVILKIKT
mgnify:CR=1 FL=1|tara:strand:+ start:215 stop:673 length:459 start_codon:yes stop_codon:yes gene_type:complete